MGAASGSYIPEPKSFRGISEELILIAKMWRLLNGVPTKEEPLSLHCKKFSVLSESSEEPKVGLQSRYTIPELVLCLQATTDHLTYMTPYQDLDMGSRPSALENLKASHGGS